MLHHRTNELSTRISHIVENETKHICIGYFELWLELYKEVQREFMYNITNERDPYTNRNGDIVFPPVSETTMRGNKFIPKKNRDPELERIIEDSEPYPEPKEKECT